MASQQIEQEFIALKDAGKINSELDAYTEGKLAAINGATDKDVQRINELFDYQTNNERNWKI